VTAASPRRRARTVEPPSGTDRPAVYSTARLNTLVCPVFVRASAIAAVLRHVSAALRLPRLRGVPRGMHPVIVEVWRVHDGVPWFGGVSAHDWSAVVGAMTGAGVFAGVGAAVGAGLGAFDAVRTLARDTGDTVVQSRGSASLRQGLAALAAGAAAGVRGGWALGARVGRRSSEWRSRVLGTYNEIIITVPCVARRGRDERRFSYVLATATDSAASMLGERAVGWGFHKIAARGTHAADGTLQVMVAASRRPFRLRVGDRGARLGWSPTVAQWATVAALDAPLLGALADGRLHVSWFDRSYSAADAFLHATPVDIESLDALVPGAGPQRVSVPALAASDPWGAVYAEGVRVTLTHPRAPGNADAL